MLVAFVICATFGALITAKHHNASSERPPKDRDPDCAVRYNETHVYRNCMYVCQLDEAFFLSDNQSCLLDSAKPPHLGVCVDGKCVPVPVEGGKNATDIAKPHNTSSKKPPKDRDPDCTVRYNETHVYRNCTYVCQLDEAFFLSDNQSCLLDSATPPHLGVCVDGQCVPVPAEEGKNATDIETPSETADQKPPGCDDNTSSNHTHQSCNIQCGDEMVALNESQPCYLESSDPPYGICVNGACIRRPDEENATDIDITDEATLAPRPPGCDDNTSSNHTHHSCNILCGDEMVALNESQPCYLQLQSITPAGPVPIPMERSETGAEVGVCQEGNCVAQPSSPTPESVD